jgi:carboxynorspermidine decarboxylase
VIDLREIDCAMQTVTRVRNAAVCRVLYALKPLAHPAVLRTMIGHVDGFACSSLFEARLARSILGTRGSVHITSPGLRTDEAETLGSLCDHVVFNSLGQALRLRSALPATARLGIRINPGLSLVDDDRYNPCRPFSKLGVPIERLARMTSRGKVLPGLSGLHFHTNCEGTSLVPLLRTVERVIDRLDPLLRGLEWINLGGGYSLNAFAGSRDNTRRVRGSSQAQCVPPLDKGGLGGVSAALTRATPPYPALSMGGSAGPLIEVVRRMREEFGLTVYIEPGAALVRSAGWLVAAVIDLFKSGGKKVAVLDTSVNHMPEVFEYQFEPDVLGDHARGEHEYLLVGGTCLAGDVFGEYGFDEPLRLGSRIVFPDAGAYTLVKAHMFNGLNLPIIYTLEADGTLGPGHRFDYRDFLRRSGVSDDASDRA